MNLEDLRSHISGAYQANILAVDTETTGLNVYPWLEGTDYLIGISIAYELHPLGIFSLYIPLRHEKDNLPKEVVVDLLKPLFKEKPLVFHNFRFDQASLATIGITEFHPKVFDTMVMAHMVMEEWPSKQLDWLSKKLLNEGKSKDEMDKWAKLFGWSSVPVSVIEPYAKQDAELTLKLWKLLWKTMKEEETSGLWDTEYRYLQLLIAMERTGVGCDREFLVSKQQLARDKMDALRADLGFDPSVRRNLADYLFDELKLPVLKRSAKTGKPSLDKAVLEEYDRMLENNPSAKTILAWRGWMTANSLLYTPMYRKIHNGRVHPHFKIIGTKTGRLSCEDPNLQQIPRKTDKPWNGDARRAFNAGQDGYELVGYDYSQLELRLATAYGSEQRLIDEFQKDDSDPFTLYSEILGSSRQDTKTFFYSNIYGAGVSKIAATMGRTTEEVAPLHAKFLDTIPGIQRASKRANSLAEQRRFVRYWTGRRRHFPYGVETYKAFNSILQGGASELVKHAMLRLEPLQNEDLKMVLQVHDEIVFMVRKGTLDKYDKDIRHAMTNFPQFGVKFKTEKKVWNA